ISGSDPLPVSVIQTLFLALDPFLAERKFLRFGALDQAGAAARAFVALEDWINDGVPLARKVAVECLQAWYGDNVPARGAWQVGGRPVRPDDLGAPTLVVLPRRDHIVPPRSAAPLAEAIPQAEVLNPPFGHIGMMASRQAPETVRQQPTSPAALDRPKLTVVMTIYNEEESISPLLEGLVAELDGLYDSYEIIAVNDGSRDASQQVLEAAAEHYPQLKIIQFRRNA